MIRAIAEELKVPVVPYEQWLNALAEDEDASANPATKILAFFSAKSTDALDDGHEAFGMVRLRTDVAESYSSTLRTCSPLQDSDYKSWLSYWRGVGLLRGTPAH
jgi:hypothetical protein